MGRRGPAPTPTAILKQRGSWRAETRPDEPKGDGNPPECPSWLSSDAEKAQWAEIVARLAGIGMLQRIDQNALGRYVRLWFRWLQCEQYIRDNGDVQPDGQEFPHVSRASKLADQMLKLEQQFGMTPSARAAMGMASQAKSKESDGIGGLINPKLVG